MDSLNIQNSNCNLCPLSENCSTKCLMSPVVEGQTYDIMLVVDRPKQDDVDSGIVFNNNLFNIICERVIKMPLDNVYRTYVSKCHSDIPLTIEMVNTCYDNFLAKEIELIKPKIIITLGETALTAVTGLSSITKHHGKPIQIRIPNTSNMCTVVPTYATGYLDKNESKVAEFAADIQLAYELSLGYEPEDKKTKYTLVDTISKFDKLMEYVQVTKHASFDFETSGLDYYSKDFFVTGISITFQQGSGYFVPLFHKEPVFPEGKKKTTEYLPPIFTSEQAYYIIQRLKADFFANVLIRKVAHNLKFDIHCARTLGINVFRGRFDDTMLMHHILDGKAPHGLKDCVARYYKELAGYEEKLAGYEWFAMPLALVGEYSAIDTDGTFRLAAQFELELLEDERSYVLYRNHAIPLCFALEQAEYNGMLIDKDFTEKTIIEVDQLIAKQVETLKNFKQVKRFEAAKIEEFLLNEVDKVQAKLKEVKDKEQAKKDATLQTLQADIEVSILKDKYANEDLVAKYTDLYAELSDEEKQSKKGIKLFETLEAAKANIHVLSKRTLNLKAKLAALPNTPPSKTLASLELKLSELKTGQVELYDGINFSSSTQMAELLYGEHGFKMAKLIDPRSKKPIDGTGKLVLNNLKDSTGFINSLLVLRSMEKINGTYIQGIYKRLDHNGYVHTSLNQTGTYTGRISSSDPNLQNIPSVGKLKDENAKYVVSKVKQMFSVPEGNALLALDFSQAELRTVAYFAQETNMMKAYADKLDLHILTGAKLGGMTLEAFYQLDKDMQKQLRTNAKAANFGLLYDMSAKGFMDYCKNTYGLVLSLSEAEKMKEAFFDLYPKLRHYHKTYKAKARQFGYVRTLFGRRVFTPDIYSSDDFKQGEAERESINAPIQGTSGEWTLFAIALLRYRLDPRIKFVNSVHDSILFYCPLDLVDEAMRIIKVTCENPPTLHYFKKEMTGIEMKIDAETSLKNWKELEPYTFE